MFVRYATAAVQNPDPAPSAVSHFSNGNRLNQWIATYVLLILWALLEIFSQGFRHWGFVRSAKPVGGAGATSATDSAATAGSGIDQPGGAGGAGSGNTPAHHWRASQAARVARNSFLISFAVTVANDLGAGASRATFILTWVFFGISVFYILMAMLLRHPALPGTLGIPQIVVGIVLFGLAFR
ncbi:hypothetical protein HDU87_000115 [Geranomyces variabilis]|uniref:Uncharacterized protein n=1 Tax=Geranomyces variabilis TaxID=109894 RepID=A0AAD5TTY3_9FUNG|nr:hypothetical protein HDU87_000115 [Geranomyces variabilis]